MGIRYRKTIEEKIGVDTKDREYISDGDDKKIYRSFEDIDIIDNDYSSEVEHLRDLIRNCSFIEFEEFMDSCFGPYDRKLEYLNRTDILVEGILIKVKKDIFAVDEKNNLYILSVNNGFVKYDFIKNRELKKLIKNNNKDMVDNCIRHYQYPFILVDITNNKIKFDKDYFEKQYLKLENKIIEDMSRKNMYSFNNKDGEKFYRKESIIYDENFNIVRDLVKEKYERIEILSTIRNEFLKKEEVSHTRFLDFLELHYQEAKHYLSRNGFSWNEIKKMNKNKIFLEANSILIYKADKEGVIL